MSIMPDMIFIHDNFLLQSDAASELYHRFAKNLPIIDYHCHLPPRDVAEDRRFSNISQIWLAGDHYKWRAMRAAGVDEKYITGSASDWEKFQAWAETVPKTLCNPLYHWTHLELKRPFGISKLLSADTAKEIWNECNAQLAKPEFSARGIMKQMNVEVVCTTDDPIDDLHWHKQVENMFPTFRPDKALAVGTEGYAEYLDKLADAAGMNITTFADVVAALKKRHDYFHECGCRLSDHGFGVFEFTGTVKDVWYSDTHVRHIRNPEQAGEVRSAILYEIAKMDAEKGWAMQLHIGAIRNNNSKMFTKLGADAGFDSIVDGNFAAALSQFFDLLDQEDILPKTIVYNLNPNWNEMLAAMLGNFQSSKYTAKMQFGSGWWFLDQKDGMERQLTCLSNLGLLSGFVGMLTDSRSFLSYTRHEYFRRILCNYLGSGIEQGLLPSDIYLVGGLVKDVSYYNAKRYFGF